MSGAPYESFSALGNITEKVSGGNLVVLDEWLQQWGTWSESVGEVGPHVRKGLEQLRAGAEEDALWSLTVLAWTRATDDLSRALADFGLRQAAEFLREDSPEVAASLLWLTHRPNRIDEREMLTLLVEAGATPQKAYGEFVASVLEAIDSGAGEQLDPDERSRVRTMFDEKKTLAARPSSPIVQVPTSRAPKEEKPRDMKRAAIFIILLVVFILSSFATQ